MLQCELILLRQTQRKPIPNNNSYNNTNSSIIACLWHNLLSFKSTFTDIGLISQEEHRQVWEPHRMTTMPIKDLRMCTLKKWEMVVERDHHLGLFSPWRWFHHQRGKHCDSEIQSKGRWRYFYVLIFLGGQDKVREVQVGKIICDWALF